MQRKLNHSTFTQKSLQKVLEMPIEPDRHQFGKVTGHVLVTAAEGWRDLKSTDTNSLLHEYMK